MQQRAAVGDVVDAALAEIAEHRPCRVEVVRVRRSSTFSEEALRRGFELLAAGTPLEGARLAIEAVNRVVECACGRSPVITVDDLLGQVWICPVCGHAEEIDERDDLELLEVTLTRLDVRSPAEVAIR